MHLFEMAGLHRLQLFSKRKGLQFLLFMKLTIAILLTSTMCVSAKGVAQQVTLHLKNATLQETFREIQRQTGYTFLYTKQMVQNAPKVNLDLTNAPLTDALHQCLKKQLLEFFIDNKIVIIRRKPLAPPPVSAGMEAPSDTGEVRGVVLSESNSPLQGATISIIALNKSVHSNARGEFVLSNMPKGKYRLDISYVGFDDFTATVEVNGNSANVTAALKQVLSHLDEVQVIAYGTSTKRFSTGSQAAVKSQDIEKQPVTNPIAALQGRMTGVLVTNANGIPGSGITMQIRGNYSLSSRADPLYIIDGVPFPAVSLSNTTTASGNVSPFNSINPQDIESISVLKDADATAIYGSRGANGVVLISTKKGKAGKTKFDVNAYSGSSVSTRVPKFLNTEEYLNIRRKAFIADNITPSPTNAQDLLSWGNGYTNFPKMILGNTAPFTNVQSAVSGGNENTRYLLSLGYHNEGSVIYGNNYDKRVSGHLNIDHYSANKKLNINTSVTYSNDNIKTLGADPFLAIYASPNFPRYDSTGVSLYWIPRDAQANTANPWSYLNKVGRTWTDNFLANTALKYAITPGLNAKVNVGFTKMFMTQQVTMPTSAFNTVPSIVAPYKNYASFGNSSVQTYIVEPQLDYNKRIGLATITALVGGTAQSSNMKGNTVTGINFATDDLIETISAAGSIYDRSNTSTQYKYISGFGRLTMRWLDKYIVNGTFRRDGSSRFGPGKKFGNFWSVSGAWIWSEENIIRNYIPVLSYGKFRASYGITGSDQIQDYRYLELYTSPSLAYNGNLGLYANQIGNPVFGWEANRKLEVAMDLGFLKDRFLFSASWYRNRSDNQLVQSPLPSQTGFDYYQANLPALIEMTSWEFELNAVNISKKDFRWQTTFNITLPDSKLLDFPNLASSAYAQTFVVGQPLKLARGYHYLGIDHANGVPQFEDQNKDNSITSAFDYINIGSLSPEFYGGLGNTITWKGFTLDVFLQFTRQNGYNAYRAFYFGPGYKVNVPDFYIKDYWEPTHTDAMQPALSTTVSNSAGAGYAFPNRFYYSDAAVSDASYIRLKNLSFAYSLPKKLTEKLHAQNLRVYIQGQNLVTWTKYEGLDPETQNATPVLKTLTGGIQLTF